MFPDTEKGGGQIFFRSRILPTFKTVAPPLMIMTLF